MTTVKRAIRIDVYNRDGNKCVICGSEKDLTVDHIRPISDGGSNHFRNLQTLCWTCNNKKGSEYKFDFFTRLKKIWYLPETISKFRNYVINYIGSIETNLKKHADSQINNSIQSHTKTLQSKIDKLSTNMGTDHSITVAGLVNSNLVRDRKIEDLEKAVIMLVEYLDLEAVPSKPYFRKRAELSTPTKINPLDNF